MTGEWPPSKTTLDHRHGDRLDNRWKQLRLATPSQQVCNRGLQSNNTSGHKGVYFDPREAVWCAYIQLGGVRREYRRCETLAEAVAARREMEERYHGEFRRAA
jgi:hypothetical protein